MTEEKCNCGLPQRWSNDTVCARCKKTIDENRISASEIVDFPSDFSINTCQCGDTVRKLGHKKIGLNRGV